jgi:hypothetical protein
MWLIRPYSANQVDFKDLKRETPNGGRLDFGKI